MTPLDLQEIVKAIKPLFGDMRAEMYAGFGELRRDIDADFKRARKEMGDGFAELRHEMNEGFALVADKFVENDHRFDRIEAKLDTFATRAEFEKMHHRITVLQDGHGVLLKRVSKMEQRVF